MGGGGGGRGGGWEGGGGPSNASALVSVVAVGWTQARSCHLASNGNGYSRNETSIVSVGP